MALDRELERVFPTFRFGLSQPRVLEGRSSCRQSGFRLSARLAVQHPGPFTFCDPREQGRDANRACGSPAPRSDALQQLLNNHPDLGDIILQAFRARRQLLRPSGEFTGRRVIGSRYSRDT
ncbi:MAG: hypothetical protein AB7N70_18350 [Dehalococcoidia bacterium]